MKYIRTKDGRIIEIIRTEKNSSILITKNGGYFPSEWVLKQSDTIEELCDGFITFRDNRLYALRSKDYWFAEAYKYALEEYNCYKEDGEDIVLIGFIKMDKSLMYVAKMNESGYLQLL